MTQCDIPQGYKSALDVRETETAIKFVKDTFKRVFQGHAAFAHFRAAVCHARFRPER